MSFFVPGSNYQTYYSYNNSGNPPKDSSFRHAFVQGQAPMLKINNSGGGVNTLSPITGDGTVGNPVTLLAAPSSCQSTLFWDSGVWRFCVSPGISEVTVGDIANGANYSLIQDALNNGCTFIRIVNNVIEPTTLNLPSNTMIYVDPNVSLTLSGGVDLTGNKALTFRGSTSIQSTNIPGTIIFQGGINCDANSRLYFFDCRVENRNTGSLIVTTTNPANYGALQASNSSFLAADASPSLFGESTTSPSSAIIVMQLQNCIVEGGGNTCQFIVGYFDPNVAVISIRGLILLGQFASSATLAATAVNETTLSDINILASGSASGTPFEWVIGGHVTNFKQGTNSAFVQLNIQSSVNNFTNLLIEGISLLSVSNVQMNNVVFTSPSPIQLVNSGYKISNAIFPTGMIIALTSTNNYISDCQMTGEIRVFGNQNTFSNIQVDSVLIHATSTGRNHFVNCLMQTTTGIQTVDNSFSNCWFQGDLTVDTGAIDNVISNSRADAFVTINIGSSNNSFTGGTKGQFSINGDNNTVSNWTDIVSMTVDNNGTFIRLSNCSTPSFFQIRGPDCTIDSCTIGQAISLQAATCPRTIINNCRIDTSNAGGGIIVQNNNNVVISNCIIGVAGGGASINNCNTVALLPPASATATLVTNCYTASQILPAGVLVSCFLL